MLGASSAFVSDSGNNQEDQEIQNVEQEQATNCGNITVGEAEANITGEQDKINFSGIYCANTGGYSVDSIQIEREGDRIEASVNITPPEDDQIVTQVITPIEFEEEETFEPDIYQVEYSINVEDETIDTGEAEIEIGEGSQNQSDDGDNLSITERIISWFNFS